MRRIFPPKHWRSRRLMQLDCSSRVGCQFLHCDVLKPDHRWKSSRSFERATDILATQHATPVSRSRFRRQQSSLRRLQRSRQGAEIGEGVRAAAPFCAGEHGLDVISRLIAQAHAALKPRRLAGDGDWVFHARSGGRVAGCHRCGRMFESCPICRVFRG